MAYLSWRVGDVTITKIVEFEGAFPGGGPGSAVPEGTPEAIKQIPWLIPHFATEEGFIRMSVHALLVETPARRIVIDTCIGNDKVRSSPMFNMIKTNFLADLAAAGWSRDSVDGVLCTHLHVDHVGWNTMLEDGDWKPTFPKARYYFGRREFEHWSTEATRPDTKVIFADSVQPILDAGLATLVEMDAVIAPEIRLIPTPGHTPGHVSVVIESKGERAVITGDIMHHPCQVAHPHWSSDFDNDKDASRVTRRAFLCDYADNGTLVIGTHFGGPTAGRVVRDGDAYRLEVVA
jgi:glyoxylase-like metal-dependent hydrolase (beta-lactamase superfamily II)